MIARPKIKDIHEDFLSVLMGDFVKHIFGLKSA